MEEHRNSDRSEPGAVPTGPDSAASLAPAPAHQNHTTTNFFIDNILRPDFGHRRAERAEPAGLTGSPDPDSGSDSSSSLPSSSSSSPRPHRRSGNGAAEGAKSADGSGGQEDSSVVVLKGAAAACTENRTLLWPAWVYCTRYSDRPSSGKKNRSRESATVPAVPPTNDVEVGVAVREFKRILYHK